MGDRFDQFRADVEAEIRRREIAPSRREVAWLGVVVFGLLLLGPVALARRAPSRQPVKTRSLRHRVRPSWRDVQPMQPAPVRAA